MRNLKICWKGTTPLIMHSCQCVNPLHPLSKEMKKLTSKRNKTEEDLVALSDLEWQSGAYYKEDIGLYVPCENIEATLFNAAKAYKQGTNFQKYTQVTDLYIPLDYGENLTLEQLIADPNHRDVRPMTVQRSKIMRTRPRFNTWKITFNLMYEETKLDLDQIVQALEYAGQYVGLCDSRPKYGKFVATVEELD